MECNWQLKPGIQVPGFPVFCSSGFFSFWSTFFALHTLYYDRIEIINLLLTKWDDEPVLSTVDDDSLLLETILALSTIATREWEWTVQGSSILVELKCIEDEN